MAAEGSRHVILVGLEVSDDERYAAYRAGITPLLEQRGGHFGHDFVVGRVLKTEGAGSAALNRVFTMVFPSREERTAFFADPAYLSVRRELFEPSVKTVEFLAEYDLPGAAQ
ncbi:MAG: hypothetical protein JWN48_5124 [Myxococcaceae bacterium]|nr:hypothetical protein [Myxococcaceae bacterium]